LSHELLFFLIEYQIFIHGERTQPCLVAVVVPHSTGNGKPKDVDTMRLMRKVAEQHAQPSHHVPGLLIIETEEWTPENGGLTASHKPARGKLMARYKLAIDMAYARAFPL